MTRRVFYSFHYELDHWRASQVRNIGMIEGNRAAHDNDWEAVKRGGDPAIKRWIDAQLVGRSCTIVLIGAQTAGRKWINYEIQQSWEERKGLLGIHIHNLRCNYGAQTLKGINPFSQFSLGNGPNIISLAQVVRVYDPPHYDSRAAHAYISNNLSAWIDEAIAIRGRN